MLSKCNLIKYDWFMMQCNVYEHWQCVGNIQDTCNVLKECFSWFPPFGHTLSPGCLAAGHCRGGHKWIIGCIAWSMHTNRYATCMLKDQVFFLCGKVVIVHRVQEVNVWTVCWDKKKSCNGHCREAAVSGNLTVLAYLPIDILPWKTV